VLTAVLRLPGIERPLTGNFATKNAVYAMIARNWAMGRAGVFQPTLDCLVGGQRSLHLLELPVSAYLSGLLWKGFGGSLDVWGRLTALGFTLGSVALLFLLVLRWHGGVAAAASALTLALSPVSVLYGRSFMLEASLVFFVVATVWAWDHWLEGGRNVWLGVASLALALALLTKIYMLVLLAPLGAMAWRARHASGGNQSRCGRTTPGRARGYNTAQHHVFSPGLCPGFSRPNAPTQTPYPTIGEGRKAVFGALAVAAAILPAAAWYAYAALAARSDSPLADRIYYSVATSATVHWPPHPLLGTVGFYGRLAYDLFGPVLTPIGLALAVAGLLNRAARRHLAWGVASIALVLLLPRKFHEMNYYWLAVLPVLAILTGLGWQLVHQRQSLPRWAIAVAVVLWIALAGRWSVGPIWNTADEDRGVVAAGAAVQALAGPEEPVATIHGTSIDLLYYCNRPGWAVDPATPSVLGDCYRQGARVLAVVAARPAAPDSKSVAPKPIAEGVGYAVYRLVGP
jgi:hypothetical protein